MLVPIIYKQAKIYIKAIKGTTFSVTEAIRLIPPMIMIPTKTIIISPIMVRALPPVIPKASTNCMAAWLDWAAFPPPKEAPIHKTAKITANVFPKRAKPRSSSPLVR